MLALLGLVASMLAQETEPASRVYAEASKSVFLIVVKSSSGEPVAQATGFSVEGNRIITNEHVVLAGTPHLDLGAVRVALKVVRTDSVNDLALLMPDGEISSPPLRLAGANPKPGTAVYALGNPEGLEKSISTGVISGIRNFRGRELLQISAPLSPGSSGGPVLAANGEVVGVAVGVLDGGQNLNFAVPAPVLRKFLRGEAGKRDVPSLLAKVTELTAMQNKEMYASEPDSPYQRLDAEIEKLLSTALEAAGSDAVHLSEVGAYAMPGHPGVAINACEKIVQAQPSGDAYTGLAMALKQKYDYDAASAQRFSPEDPILKRAEAAIRSAFRATRQPSARMCANLADILDDRSLPDEARTAYSKLYDVAKAQGEAPLVEEAERGLVRTNRALNKSAECDRWFDELVEIGKATQWDWHAQAKRLDARKDYLRAAVAYVQAADDRTFWKDWCMAGSAYAVAGAYDSALNASRACIRTGKGKDDADKLLGLAYSVIASILNQRGVYEESVYYAEEAAAIAPGNAFYQHDFARSLLGLRRFEEAVKASKEAIRLSDGKYDYMHFTLASAYFESGNWRAAAQSYEKAAEMDPKDDAAPYNIALCYARLGYYRDAASWYEEVLRRNPNHKDRRDILNRIRLLRQ